MREHFITVISISPEEYEPVREVLEENPGLDKKRIYAPIVVAESPTERDFSCRTKEQADHMEKILKRGNISYRRNDLTFTAKIQNLDELYEMVVPKKDIYVATGQPVRTGEVVTWVKNHYGKTVYTNAVAMVKEEFGMCPPKQRASNRCTRVGRLMIIDALVQLGGLKNELY